jgi:hypothetical protein
LYGQKKHMRGDKTSYWTQVPLKRFFIAFVTRIDVTLSKVPRRRVKSLLVEVFRRCVPHNHSAESSRHFLRQSTQCESQSPISSSAFWSQGPLPSTRLTLPRPLHPALSWTAPTGWSRMQPVTAPRSRRPTLLRFSSLNSPM